MNFIIVVLYICCEVLFDIMTLGARHSEAFQKDLKIAKERGEERFGFSKHVSALDEQKRRDEQVRLNVLAYRKRKSGE